MTDDPCYIDPERAPGAFIYGLTQIDVAEDGMSPRCSVEVIDVLAALAETVKQLCAAERTPGDMLLRRLAMATLDLLSTAFARTPEDAEIVATWRQAYAEFRGASQ
jgi:hypothetical protein